MLHCDLRLRWKIASDLRFQAAISESKTHYFCGSSGDLDAEIASDCDCAILVQGFPKRVLVRGEILKNWVVREPVAISNFASNPYEKSLSLYRIEIGDPAPKNAIFYYCNRCAHPPQLLRFALLTKTPLLETPNW